MEEVLGDEGPRAGYLVFPVPSFNGMPSPIHDYEYTMLTLNRSLKRSIAQERGRYQARENKGVAVFLGNQGFYADCAYFTHR